MAEHAYSTPVILKDVFVAADGTRTTYEVTASQIYLSHDGFRALQPVPLDPASESYNHVSEEVRAQMARKIARLVPTLSDTQHRMLQAHVFQVLETIARDQLPRVRQMMAEELKTLPDAPPSVIRDLAWDDDLGVCAPILEYSPLLHDHELLEIIASSPMPGVLEAIARRRHVTQPVSRALVRTHHVPAITTLLGNKGAEFDEEIVAEIIRETPQPEMWREALDARPELTQHTVGRIAGIMAAAVSNELEFCDKIDPVQKRDLNVAVRTRLQSPQLENAKQAEARARECYKAGKLDENMLLDAIANGQKEFVMVSLAFLAKLPKDIVKRMLSTQNARAVTALAWKAKLSMRVAMQLQMKVAQIHHTKLLYAKGGTDYPLPPAVCNEYIEHFTG